MDEGDFARQRRNVIVASIVIIAYNVAGGNIKHFKFYGMELDNEWAIVGGVWLSFAYVLWRYWTYSDSKYSEFGAKFMNTVSDEPGVRQSILPFGRALNTTTRDTPVACFVARVLSGLRHQPFGRPRTTR